MTAPASTARLAVEGLTVAFGGLRAVNEVSFAMAAGAFLGIVGPNGAGKSTLVQTITGFVRPSAGRILFKGEPIGGLASETIAAKGIARTFQTSRVFPALSVGESVLVGVQRGLIGGGRVPVAFNGLAEPVAALLGLPAYRKREAECRERAEAVMRLFGDRLWTRRDQPAHSLSYANRRRLDIARALAAEPDLLLLDEPTAGMNPTETRELAVLIATIAAGHPDMSIVLVEHKLDVVRDLASRVVVMDNGGLLVEGPPEAVLGDIRVVEAYLGKRGAEEARALGLAP